MLQQLFLIDACRSATIFGATQTFNLLLNSASKTATIIARALEVQFAPAKIWGISAPTKGV